MSTISNDNKAIARHVANAFGGKPAVREYLHDNLPLRIDILAVEDQPDPGVVSYGTIGLSDTPLKWDDGEFKVRIELCGSARSEKTLFPNVLASVAFSIMRSQVVYYPGRAIKNYFKEYYDDTNLPHLYFTSPFLWDDLKTLRLDQKDVTWLLCFPISEAELDFLTKEGGGEFENLLETLGVDVFDVGRDCVIEMKT